MELFSAEAVSIEKQVSEWLEHPEYELETTFGTDGRVDATTFITVAKRLRAKGYTSLPQSDRMTIMTLQHVRFTLSSMGIIQQYCRDDILAGIPYEAMIKDRTTSTSNVDLSEYNMRIKARREIQMSRDDADVKNLLEQWSTLKKAFRIIRRWTFEGEGIRIDMSIVRSTRREANGAYKWQRKFREQDIMKSPPIYEIEVELLRKEGDTAKLAMKRLIKGSGEILRGIQKSSILIRKSMKENVLAEYRAMTGTAAFRGPSMRTLQKKNYLKERTDREANIRDGYNVTDKADGLRCLGFVNKKGELFLIDMNMATVYRTGLKQPECRESMVDGEWVTLTKEKEPTQQFLVFDIFYAADKRDVSQLPFQAPAGEREEKGRYGELTHWIKTWNKGPEPTVPSLTPQTRLQTSMKTFLFGKAGDESIFRAARRILDTARSYYTDGLIFTPNALPLPAGAAETFYEQFKWKPPADNTVDFLVKFEKSSEVTEMITTGVNPDTNETVSYKTLRLFVGSSVENSRNIILNELELPKKSRMIRGANIIKGEYKPTLFTPREIPDTQASICNLPVETDPDTGETYVKTEADEPIQDKTIVEMSYNPKAAPGWRWIPLRVRMDKTERLQSGTLGRTLNSDKVAEDVWNSIYDPITVHMIKTGDDQPSEQEQQDLMRGSAGLGKKYYNRNKGSQEDQMLTRTMRDFHNKYIKEGILYRVGLQGMNKTLIDTACGVGADLQIWRRQKVDFVLGVDFSDDNIRSEKDSIYRRYLESIVSGGGRDSVPQMVFAIGDSSKNYKDGAAGKTEEEKNILRSVLGGKPIGIVPPYIESTVASRLKIGADCMSCMFALHYFFESPESLRGYVRNISENLKIGGYFIGCCFDGEKVFDFLRKISKGENKKGIESDATIWTITKQYEEEDLPEGEESIGLPIDVEFSTIGTTQREYLVSFKFLTEIMGAIGCEPLSNEELKKLGLPASSSTFDASWATAKKAGKDYAMPNSVKEFSFLNRWFVFKRVRQAGQPESVSAGLVSPASASVKLRPGTVSESKEDFKNEEEDKREMATLRAVERNAPPVADDSVQRYAAGELFQFYSDAAEKDVLGIEDKMAGQWLSPTAPFPINDPTTPDTVYPSLDHYLAAMRYAVASNAPQLAATIFSREGTIHQKFLQKRLVVSDVGKKPISEKNERELLKEEATEVRDAIRPASFKRYKATFDEAKWAAKRDDVLREGLMQRWQHDARFQKIVKAARDKGKTLLYYSPGANSKNMGGVRKADGHIEGDNRIGKIIMELAGFY